MGKITISSDISSPPENKNTETTLIQTSEPTILTKFIEVIKEVPVEIPVYIKQIEKEYIEVPVERIVEVVKEVPVEVIKFVDKEVEVIKEVPKNVEVLMERIITQEIKVVPRWAWCLMFVEFIIILLK